MKIINNIINFIFIVLSLHQYHCHWQ